MSCPHAKAQVLNYQCGLHSATLNMYSVGEINQNRIKLGNQYQHHTEKHKINAYSIFLNNKG